MKEATNKKERKKCLPRAGDPSARKQMRKVEIRAQLAFILLDFFLTYPKKHIRSDTLINHSKFCSVNWDSLVRVRPSRKDGLAAFPARLTTDRGIGINWFAGISSRDGIRTIRFLDYKSAQNR